MFYTVASLEAVEDGVGKRQAYNFTQIAVKLMAETAETSLVEQVVIGSSYATRQVELGIIVCLSNLQQGFALADTCLRRNDGRPTVNGGLIDCLWHLRCSIRRKSQSLFVLNDTETFDIRHVKGVCQS